MKYPKMMREIAEVMALEKISPLAIATIEQNIKEKINVSVYTAQDLLRDLGCPYTNSTVVRSQYKKIKRLVAQRMKLDACVAEACDIIQTRYREF